MTNQASTDARFMRATLDLARRGLGRVAPNPAVGSILVRPDMAGRVVGRGWTQPGGRPHAETEALRRAGDLAQGATLYVSLEPCSHTGQTGPCADAVIKAGITRAVIATTDPDPRVAGRGIGKLQDAGIDVSVGLMSAEAIELNLGFIYKIQKTRPLYSWKTATSLDGKIATSSGHSKWITAEQARRTGHVLRAEHDAILVGIGTALADDPDLSCRLPGLMDRSPVRIIMDGKLRLPLDHRLVKTAKTHPTWVITSDDASTGRQTALIKTGVSIFRVPVDADDRLCLAAISSLLVEQDITRVLIEGGATVATSFLKSKVVDQIYWFRAPKIIGSDGLSATNALDILQLEDTTPFTRRRSYDMGPDTLDVFELERPTT